MLRFCAISSEISGTSWTDENLTGKKARDVGRLQREGKKEVKTCAAPVTKNLFGARHSTDFAHEDKRNFPAARCIKVARRRGALRAFVSSEESEKR